MNGIDNRPRYAPDQVMTTKGFQRVLSYTIHGKSRKRPDCPIRPDVKALELKTAGGSRWYGCDDGWINSELRVVVQGFTAGFMEMAAWEICDKP